MFSGTYVGVLDKGITRLACHQKKRRERWKKQTYVLIQGLWEMTPLFVVRSGSETSLCFTRTRDKDRMEALWCLCLWHNRGSEWFSPPARLREAQPAGCCFLRVFDGKSCEQTHLLCSFTSVNLLCLFTHVSLICVKEDQMLRKGRSDASEWQGIPFSSAEK